MNDEKATEPKTALERAQERLRKAQETAEAAAKQARQTRARLSQLEQRKNCLARKADFRRKIIVGAVALKECPELLPLIIAKMPEVVRKAYEEATVRAMGNQ